MLDSDYIKPIYSQKCDYQQRSTSRSLSTRTECFVVIHTKQTLFFCRYYFLVHGFSSTTKMLSAVSLFFYSDRVKICIITFMIVLCVCVLHVCVCAYLTSTSLNEATAVTPSAGGHLGSSFLRSLL